MIKQIGESWLLSPICFNAILLEQRKTVVLHKAGARWILLRTPDLTMLQIVDDRPDGIFAGGTIILAHPSVLARQKVEGSLQIKAGSLVFQRLTHGLETLFGIPIIYLVVIQRQHLEGMKAIGCTDKRLLFSGTQDFQMTGTTFNHCQFSRGIGDGQCLSGTNGDRLQKLDGFLGGTALFQAAAKQQTGVEPGLDLSRIYQG